MTRRDKIFRICGWLLYAVWHIMFVVVTFTLLLPHVAVPLFVDATHGAAPWHYVVYISVVIALPFLSIIYVLARLRNRVLQALKLFYLVELPLMLVLLLRVMLFREAPFLSQFVFCNIYVSIICYFAVLIFDPQPKTVIGSSLLSIVSSVKALVGMYLGLLLGIFFFPFVVELFHEAESFRWSDFIEFVFNTVKHPMIFVYIVLFSSSMIFFLSTPFILLFGYVKQFIIHCKQTSGRQVLIAATCVLIMEGVVFSFYHEQPQELTFELLDTLPTEKDAQKKLLSQTEQIREGLINSYLATYRYISATGSMNSIVDYQYAKIFGKESVITSVADTAFFWLVSPFLYTGESFYKDKKRAAELYEQVFDAPIEKAEKDKILEAVVATWQEEGNEAGLMNAASHYVLLKEQTIEIEEKGDLAIVTINQILENQTFDLKEVVMHFALPDDAVVTGVWMSDDLNYPQKYEYVVAPRGAAQSVYKAEVKRRIDPALLEKVGPVQYRLRVYPVPARVMQDRRGFLFRHTSEQFNVKPISVQFQYVVGVDEGWPLPSLLEKRNIFWNETTKRSHEVIQESDWLPEKIEATKRSSKPQQHVASIGGQTVVALPRSESARSGILDGKIAVIIDGSYSMRQKEEKLEEQLQWLREAEINYQLFWCQSSCGEIDSFDKDEMVFFGNAQIAEQLSEWNQKNDTVYASVMVLTDSGSYELTDESKELSLAFDQPLWLVHLGGNFPYAYGDVLLDVLKKSNGGIARTLLEACENFLLLKEREVGENGVLAGVSKNYLWYTDHSSTPALKDEAFEAMAANQLIMANMSWDAMNSLEQLDRVHEIAKRYNIVSYYSSMLVLVEDRQRHLLKQAEEQKDRFDREVETGKNNAGTPGDILAVPGVPEPEEWALLVIAAIFLLISGLRRRSLLWKATWRGTI
jgi:putative PEP-CTERM system integral membrane protein